MSDKKRYIPEYRIRDHLIDVHGMNRHFAKKSDLVDLARWHIDTHENNAGQLTHYHKKDSDG